MRVRHYPSVDSSMARYWRPGDLFELTDNAGNVVMTFTGEQLLHRLVADVAAAKGVLDMAKAIGRTTRDLYPKRRLLAQHRALRTLPSSPHAPVTDTGHIVKSVVLFLMFSLSSLVAFQNDSYSERQIPQVELTNDDDGYSPDYPDTDLRLDF